MRPQPDPAELPPGWTSAPIHEVSRFVTSGSRGWGKYYSESGPRFVRVGDFARGSITLNKDRMAFIRPPVDSEGERTAVSVNDVLLTITADVGMVAVATHSLGAAYVNQHVALIRPLTGLDGRAIAYSLLDPTGFQRVVRAAQYGATKPGLSLGQIRDFSVKLPPLLEQYRIVDALDSYLTRLDAATEGLKRVEANLKRYRASVLKAAFEGRLVPTEADLAKRGGHAYEPASTRLTRILKERRRDWEEAELAGMTAKRGLRRNDDWKSKYQEPAAPDTSILPELPEGWCWVSVSQLLTAPLCHGRSVQTRPGGFPVLRLTALGGEAINLGETKDGDWDEEQARPFCVEEGDFLIARGNGSIRLVGRGGIVGRSGRRVAFPDTLIRFRPDARLIVTRFLAAMWTSFLVRKQIEGKAKTTAGIHKVNQADLRSIVLPLPPIHEQTRILVALDEILSSIFTIEPSLATHRRRTERLRQSILKWAFEGKLVDQNPKDEPASDFLTRIKTDRDPDDVRRRTSGSSKGRAA